MKIMPHERRPLIEGDEITPRPRDQRQQIRDYPGRTVSVDTAYQRMRTNTPMSLHDACTVPLNYEKKTQSPRQQRLRDEQYVHDLRTLSVKGAAAKWGLSRTTIKVDKRELPDDLHP